MHKVKKEGTARPKYGNASHKRNKIAGKTQSKSEKRVPVASLPRIDPLFSN